MTENDGAQWFFYSLDNVDNVDKFTMWKSDNADKVTMWKSDRKRRSTEILLFTCRDALTKPLLPDLHLLSSNSLLSWSLNAPTQRKPLCFKVKGHLEHFNYSLPMSSIIVEGEGFGAKVNQRDQIRALLSRYTVFKKTSGTLDMIKVVLVGLSWS